MTTALTAPAPETAALCRQTIQHHSKSFALASKVLPPASRDTAAVVYTWCRRVDDAIDEAPPAEQPAALARLESELDAIYSDRVPADGVLAAFQAVVRDHRIPRHYPAELIAGMQMDASGTRYATVEQLLQYCYRVASTVGLMMSHVMGVRDEAALKQAAHLGIAMQLTNICRDVAEDWDRGRLYLPDEMLAACGLPDLRSQLGGPLPVDARARLAGAVEETLALADRFYRSGDRGLAALPWRCAFAVRTARLVYSRIGDRIRAQRCDVLAGRAYVPTWRKALLLLRSAATSLIELPIRAVRRNRYLIPQTTTEFPYGVFPV